MSTLFRLVLTFWREYHLKKRIYSTRHTNWRHWCQKLHRDALDIAQQTKQQLIDFEVVDEDDTEQEKCSKQQRKTQINEDDTITFYHSQYYAKSDKKHEKESSILH
eukprot:917586_1